MSDREMTRQERAEYIWAVLKSYLLDECSLDCAAVGPADEKYIVNALFNSIPVLDPAAAPASSAADLLDAEASRYDGDAFVYTGSNVSNILATQATRIRLATAATPPPLGEGGLAGTFARYAKHFADHTNTVEVTLTPKEIQQIADALAATSGEPVAWRVKNDYGHWIATTDRALAETWRDIERLEVEPLYSPHSRPHQRQEGS